MIHRSPAGDRTGRNPRTGDAVEVLPARCRSSNRRGFSVRGLTEYTAGRPRLRGPNPEPGPPLR